MLKAASRWSGWSLLAAAVVVAGLWGLSLFASRHVSIQNHAIGIHRGAIELGMASVIIGRGPKGWMLSPGVPIPLERPKGWLPTKSGATLWLAQGAGTSAPITLRVDYVRFAFLLPLLAGSGLMLWWLGRRRIKPGHCACGYDLRGLGGGKCPECGKGLVGKALSVLAGLGRRGAWQIGKPAWGA